MKNKRRPHIFIYPKDVCLFTRKSQRHALMLLEKIRLAVGKNKDQPITLVEFCIFCNLDEDHVYNVLDEFG
ncbi:MAG: hypothetical protein J7621_28210 [Niastella sp.]|nr:hypothetical protein [Niastella sp.]